MARKILVIDDEPDFVDAIKMRLEANGYVMVSASDGREGVDKAKRERPDLILLDLVMPNVNGILALSMLKTDPKIAHIPVVILTAKTDSDYITDTMKLGAVDYIVKPADMQVLIEVVRKYC